MAEDSDGIAEAFEGQLRIAVTAAGRVGEVIARAREAAARRAEAASQQEARELASRFEAEKRTARVELGSVYRSDWWDRATPEQIGGALTTARAWSREDPEAVRAEGRIGDELRTRYGVDVDNAGGDQAAVRAAVEAAQARRQAAPDNRAQAAEEAEAAALLGQADRADRAADNARQQAENAPDPEDRERAQADVEHHENRAAAARQEAGPLYDSAERRATAAADLHQQGIDKPAVDAKIAADVSQAKPATAAVARTSAKNTKARPTRSRSARVQRTELGR